MYLDEVEVIKCIQMEGLTEFSIPPSHSPGVGVGPLGPLMAWGLEGPSYPWVALANPMQTEGELTQHLSGQTD